MKAQSLTHRVVGYLVVAQVCAFALAWVMTIPLGLAGVDIFTTTLDELATGRAVTQVRDSLARDASGQLRIAPTPELEEALRLAPTMQYAAFDSRAKSIVAGSSPALVAALYPLIDISPTHTHFVLGRDSSDLRRGLMEPRRTPYGRMHIAVYGQKFCWSDLLYAFETEMQWLSIYLVVAIVMSAGVAWFAVRRGLAPLCAVAYEAAAIDMSSLDQRLSVDHVPLEVSPLVNGMNEALARLDAGAARQRRFTANAAHELRTPVAILSARLDAKEEPGFKNDLKRDARRIRNIVEQLLATAKLGEERIGAATMLDLAEITRDAVADAALLAIRSERQIAFEGPSAPLLVRGERNALQSVIANLIDNALRAEPVGGSVMVRLADGRLEVIDHGKGILHDEREQVFEPFWRKAEPNSGVGLGLAISREIVERLHGRIWIEDTPCGGATFMLQLPSASGR